MSRAILRDVTNAAVARFRRDESSFAALVNRLETVVEAARDERHPDAAEIDHIWCELEIINATDEDHDLSPVDRPAVDDLLRRFTRLLNSVDTRAAHLSVQRALLGRVTPELRLVTLDPIDGLTVRFVYEGAVDDGVRERVTLAETDVMCDFPDDMDRVRAVIEEHSEGTVGVSETEVAVFQRHGRGAVQPPLPSAPVLPVGEPTTPGDVRISFVRATLGELTGSLRVVTYERDPDEVRLRFSYATPVDNDVRLLLDQVENRMLADLGIPVTATAEYSPDAPIPLPDTRSALFLRYEEDSAVPRPAEVHISRPRPPAYKELVDYGEVVGRYVDPLSVEETETSLGVIVHSPGGVHIIPARPMPAAHDGRIGREFVVASLNRALQGEDTRRLRRVAIDLSEQVRVRYVCAEPTTDEVRELVDDVEAQLVADLHLDTTVESVIEPDQGEPIALAAAEFYAWEPQSAAPPSRSPLRHLWAAKDRFLRRHGPKGR